MSIANYSELQDTVADWLNREDLDAVIPTFISLFEAQFNADPRARVQSLVNLDKAHIGSEFAPVPNGYIQMQHFEDMEAANGRKVLKYLSPYQMSEYRPQIHDTGQAAYFTIVGNHIRLLPAPGETHKFEMTYFAEVDALSDTNPTNTILKKHPDLYLYGSLLQAEPYLKNDERVQTWSTLFNRGMERLEVTDQRAQASGSPLQMRTRSFG